MSSSDLGAIRTQSIFSFNIFNIKLISAKLERTYIITIIVTIIIKIKVHQSLERVHQFSEDIGMEFGIDKCKVLEVRKGKPIKTTDVEISDTVRVESMNGDELYKYLGYHQHHQINHKLAKTLIIKNYKQRIHSILKSQLNARNKTKAINTFATPLLTYSFGIIQWTQTDIKNLQIKTRTIMTKHRDHHPKAAIERITLPRKKGGRGLVDINNLLWTQIETLRRYFHSKQLTSKLHRAVVLADNNQSPLNLSNLDINLQDKIKTDENKLIQWSQKEIHGRHYYALQQSHIDSIASNSWLSHGQLMAETEGFMVAIQDEVISTKNYQKYIIRNPQITDDRCRLCAIGTENIQHITSGCSRLSQSDYLHRHNQISNIIHQKLANKYNLVNTYLPYYKYVPTAVLENETHKLYWDRGVITDRTIHHNRPDIVLINKETKSTLIIDIAVPNTHNLLKVYSEKQHKYTDLKEEMKRMWHQNSVKTIPLVLSATGVIPNSLHDNLKILDLHPNTYIEMQKAAIICTCRIVRKFLGDDA